MRVGTSPTDHCNWSGFPFSNCTCVDTLVSLVSHQILAAGVGCSFLPCCQRYNRFRRRRFCHMNFHRHRHRHWHSVVLLRAVRDLTRPLRFRDGLQHPSEDQPTSQRGRQIGAFSPTSCSNVVRSRALHSLGGAGGPGGALGVSVVQSAAHNLIVHISRVSQLEASRSSIEAPCLNECEL